MVLCALILVATSQQVVVIDPAKEPALEKTVSLNVQGLELPDAMKALAAQAGAPIESVMNLADLKVTMLCKDEPAASMMSALADVLDCEWTKDQGIYRIRMDREMEGQRQQYLDAESKRMRAQVEKDLALLMRNEPVGSAPKSHRSPAGEAGTSLVANMLASFDSNGWSKFWRGEPETWAPTVGGTPSKQAYIDESKRVIVRFDPILDTLHTSPETPADKAKTRLVPYSTPPADLAILPYGKSILAWSAQGSIPKDDDRFSKKVVGVPVPQSALNYERPPTCDDQMQKFFSGTGVPVVSDSFSLPCLVGAGPQEASRWLEQLPDSGIQARYLHDVLEVRHVGAWRLRMFEIPTQTLDMYAKLSAKEPLRFMDYANFIERLKPAQLTAVSIEGAVSLPFDPMPLTEMLPAIELYSRLTPEQRGLSGSGLAAERLSPAQKQSYVDAALLAALQNHTIPEFMGRATAGDLRDQGILTAEENEVSATNKNRVQSRRFVMALGPTGRMVTFSAQAKA